MEPAPVAAPRLITREELTELAIRRLLHGLFLNLRSLRLRLLEYALEKQYTLEECLQLLLIYVDLLLSRLSVLVYQITHHIDATSLQFLATDHTS